MKAVRIHEFGGTERLRIDDVPMPQCGAGQAVIRVFAASVNPVDQKLAANAMKDFMSVPLPWVPGADFSGIVHEAEPGAKVSRGDLVYGSVATGQPGAYAQFILADVNALAPKPTTLTHEEAASVPIAGQTAWQGLFEYGQLKPDETVLIHGASGGVGSMAVQLARWREARIFATCSHEHVDYLRSLGADHVIDYASEKFETVVKDADLVFDLIGGETQDHSFAVLKEGGRLISTTKAPSKQKAAEKRIEARMMHMQPSSEQLARLAQLLDCGAIKTFVAKTYPLREVQQAWTAIQKGHTRGKIVLEVPQDSVA